MSSDEDGPDLASQMEFEANAQVCGQDIFDGTLQITDGFPPQFQKGEVTAKLAGQRQEFQDRWREKNAAGSSKDVTVKTVKTAKKKVAAIKTKKDAAGPFTAVTVKTDKTSAGSSTVTVKTNKTSKAKAAAKLKVEAKLDEPQKWPVALPPPKRKRRSDADAFVVKAEPQAEEPASDSVADDPYGPLSWRRWSLDSQNQMQPSEGGDSPKVKVEPQVHDGGDSPKLDPHEGGASSKEAQRLAQEDAFLYDEAAPKSNDDDDEDDEDEGPAPPLAKAWRFDEPTERFIVNINSRAWRHWASSSEIYSSANPMANLVAGFTYKANLGEEEWTDAGNGLTPASIGSTLKAAAVGGNAADRKKATAFAVVVAACFLNPKKLAVLKDWGFNDDIEQILEELQSRR